MKKNDDNDDEDLKGPKEPWQVVGCSRCKAPIGMRCIGQSVITHSPRKSAFFKIMELEREEKEAAEAAAKEAAQKTGGNPSQTNQFTGKNGRIDQKNGEANNRGTKDGKGNKAGGKYSSRGSRAYLERDKGSRYDRNHSFLNEAPYNPNVVPVTNHPTLSLLPPIKPTKPINPIKPSELYDGYSDFNERPKVPSPNELSVKQWGDLAARLRSENNIQNPQNSQKTTNKTSIKKIQSGLPEKVKLPDIQKPINHQREPLPWEDDFPIDGSDEKKPPINLVKKISATPLRDQPAQRELSRNAQGHISKLEPPGIKPQDSTTSVGASGLQRESSLPRKDTKVISVVYSEGDSKSAHSTPHMHLIPKIENPDIWQKMACPQCRAILGMRCLGPLGEVRFASHGARIKAFEDEARGNA